MDVRARLVILFFLLSFAAMGQNKNAVSFQVVPLGIRGGLDESNLSAYMIAPINSTDFICLDAGTITAGIQKAVSKRVFKVSTEDVLKKYIKGYFISHAHLDHVSGLIISSPADSTKTVYAPFKSMEMIKDHYFNDVTWANFGDSGHGYLIKKYHFQDLKYGEEIPVKNTNMMVKTLELSHVNPYESAAFLIKDNESFVLYLGDTGADEVEKSDKLGLLWKDIAPLVSSKKLKGIFIEVSFSNEQPNASLYGHLTPRLLMNELTRLEEVAGKGSLKNFKIVITHMKPPLQNIKLIKKQLKENNIVGAKLIFPKQGKRFFL